MDRVITRRYPHLKRITIITLITALAVTGGALAWREAHMSTFRADSRDLIIADVTSRTFDDYIRVSGHVETGVVVQVSALETGIVEHKTVEEGAMINAGDIILTLHNPNLRQQILDSEAQLAEKQNMLRDTEIAMEKDRLQIKQELLTTRTELNRKRRLLQQQESLLAENLTSREDYLHAKEDYDLAVESMNLLRERQRQDSIYRSVQVGMMRESLANMHQNLLLVRQRADNLNIRATHGGQLGNLTAEIGQSISAGQQVGQINILDNFKIAALIDEHYIDRVHTGLTGEMERQGRKFNVTVTKVYPEVTQGQFKVDLALSDTQPENIRVGQTCHVDLRLGEPTQGVVIPRGQFFRNTGGRWIYVLNADGTEATRRDITIGRQNPRYYEVTHGLTPGERVLISEYTDFGDADKIIISR